MRCQAHIQEDLGVHCSNAEGEILNRNFDLNKYNAYTYIGVQ